MKKILAILLVVMLIISMTVPAYAYDFSWWKPSKTVNSSAQAEAITPKITDARYVHTGIKRLQIEWEAVENADSYVVLIVKANGEVVTYTTPATMLYLKDADCPKAYVEETNTWTAATVRVMAIIDTSIGDWSVATHISCNKLH